MYIWDAVSRRGIILPECISITIQILKIKSDFTFIPYGIFFFLIWALILYISESWFIY